MSKEKIASDSKIITDRQELDKSLREIAYEKSNAGKGLTLSELEDLIACFVPASSLMPERKNFMDDYEKSEDGGE